MNAVEHARQGALVCSCGKRTTTTQGLRTHITRMNNAAAVVPSAAATTAQPADTLDTLDALELAYLRNQAAYQDARRAWSEASAAFYRAEEALAEATRVRQDWDAAQVRSLEQWTEARDAAAAEGRSL